MAFSLGVFTRLYSWVTDRDNAVKIRADRMDAEMDGMATGLSTALLKDGTQTPTANIPMNSKKFTGLAAGSASGDSVAWGQASQVVGHTAALSIGGNTDSLEVLGTTAATGGIAFGMFSATPATAAHLDFYKSANAAVGSATVVASGEGLGSINWYGAQQTGTFATQTAAAQIRAEADGVVTSGASADMPGRLLFLTTPDGSGTPTERVRIDKDGLVTLAAGQIKFPATANPSADANTLDDYEELTFTPTIAFGGAAVGVTYGTQTGTYTKIGNLVHAKVLLVLTSKGSSVGAITIEGLPFTPAGGNNACSFGNCVNFTGLTGTLHGAMAATSQLALNQWGAAGITAITNTSATNTTSITLNVTYLI